MDIPGILLLVVPLWHTLIWEGLLSSQAFVQNGELSISSEMETNFLFRHDWAKWSMEVKC